MGNADTKLHFRKAVIQLTTKTQPVDVSDDDFWDQFWSDSVTTVQDVFTLLPSAEIRALREESPSTLRTVKRRRRSVLEAFLRLSGWVQPPPQPLH